MVVGVCIKAVEFVLAKLLNQRKRFVLCAGIYAWDSSEYGGQRYIAIPSDKIWTPDIYDVNTAVATRKSRITMVSAASTGFMFWTPHHEFIVGCVIDVKAFTFESTHVQCGFSKSLRKAPHLTCRLQPYHKSPSDLSTSLQNIRQAQTWGLWVCLEPMWFASSFDKHCTAKFRSQISESLYYSVNLGMIPLCIMLISLVVNVSMRNEVSQPMSPFVKKVLIEKLGFILRVRCLINECRPLQPKELKQLEDARLIMCSVRDQVTSTINTVAHKK
ncbi:hypothetical protein CAPTEDRAFT_206505 [Capitella teleta]|uniref:Neurotransmitter-gated ion-channel ligand-binding domain-containing protein n=1 Tax=Capitella teleta TaxID=283909 RepID=R7T4P7_CAPTE|nr:hypothetical protein CAPTEDRAFT_206505 [Capitella teleta]|eukprot:ELT88042.1 hypothetical protein CAPTEDRAFT_206505 [Capitella teleta]